METSPPPPHSALLPTQPHPRWQKEGQKKQDKNIAKEEALSFSCFFFFFWLFCYARFRFVCTAFSPLLRDEAVFLLFASLLNFSMAFVSVLSLTSAHITPLCTNIKRPRSTLAISMLLKEPNSYIGFCLPKTHPKTGYKKI